MADGSMDTVRRLQPLSELRRKADKAVRKKQKLWTQEELDLAYAQGQLMMVKMRALPRVRAGDD